MSENTKILRIESVIDGLLARLIMLPAPLTSVVLLVLLGGAFAAGAILL